MKLIEVVVLMGAHCISPVEQTGAATEVGKVECAVVIEKDTDAGTVRIVPAGASRAPEVVAVLERLDGGPALAPGTTIEPANAPPAEAIAPPPDLAQTKAAEPPAPQAPPAAAERAEEPAKTDPPKAEAKKAKPASTKAAKGEAAAKPSSKCRGAAKPKWYTNAEGRRKYRCVLPG